MSMWSEVVESLRTMSVWQLLFAFVACTGYALAQGRLIASRAKWAAMALAALAALAFMLEAERWVDGFVLIAVALVGMAAFVATVWLVSRALGMSAGAAPRTADSLLSLPPSDHGDVPAPGPTLAPHRHPAPSH